jgi:hypothetical protein
VLSIFWSRNRKENESEVRTVSELENMKSKSLERNKIVTFIFEETGERFEIEKKVAIPIVESLRIRQRMKESPENMSIDLVNTAQMLLILSGVN